MTKQPVVYACFIAAVSILALLSSCSRPTQPSKPPGPIPPVSAAPTSPNNSAPTSPSNSATQEDLWKDSRDRALQNGPDRAVYAVAENENTYGIYLRNSGRSKLITQVSVESVASYQVATVASPDYTHIALIPEFDGRFGTRLVVIQSDGTEVTSKEGYFSSVVWAFDGQSLAALSRQDVNAPQPLPPSLSVFDLTGKETTLSLTADVSQLLGFTKDGQSLFVTRMTGREFASPEAFARLDLSTGSVADLLTSPNDGPYYRQFQLRYSGQADPIVSYVSAPSLRSEEGDPFILSLTRIDGHEKRDVLVTNQPILDYAWSFDGATAAYVTPKGVWLAHGSNEPEMLLAGASWEWHLDQVFGDSVWLRNDLLGFHQLRSGQNNTLPTVPKL